MGRTVVLIHGAWVTPACWDDFKARYEARGYTCLAPAWPYDDRPVAELRADPAPELANVGVKEIVDHYAGVIEALEEPPVLIGHSFGGLFVQMLLDRGLGAVGVAIDSAPPRGVLARPKAVRASFHVLRTWRSWRRVLTISFKDFAWAFVHTLAEAEQRAVYGRHVVPTPGRPFLQAALGKANRVNWKNGARPPLLLIAGGVDRTVPPGMNRSNLRKYRRSSAVTDLTEFPGRTHWIISGPGWEEVADHAIGWAEEHLPS